jgi:hypothetical protein
LRLYGIKKGEKSAHHTMKRLFCFLLLLLLALSCQKKPVPPVLTPPAPTTPPVSHEHVHKETKIPTPLAQLPEAPLDLYAACMSPEESMCSLLMLYSNRVEILDWKSGKTRTETFPPELLSPTPSRAPSGKILPASESLMNRLAVTEEEKRRIQYIVTTSDLNSILYFDAEFRAPHPLICNKCPIPIADPGLNTFLLRDGEFYDFELLPDNELAVIDEKYHLSIGGKGTLISANMSVGSTFCVSLPYIYTSSPSLPGQPDALLKFQYQNGQIVMESNRAFDGEIRDLLIFDLNQDGQNEMIVTLKTSRGIFLDILENF